jgi:hypothetical protein
LRIDHGGDLFIGLAEDCFERVEAVRAAGQQSGAGYFFLADEAFGLGKFGAEEAFRLQAAQFGHRAAEGDIGLGAGAIDGSLGRKRLGIIHGIDIAGAGGQRFLDLRAAAQTPHGVQDLGGHSVLQNGVRLKFLGEAGAELVVFFDLFGADEAAA